MPFTSVSWSDKETITQTKMNTMTGNDDYLKDEVEKRVLAGPNNTGDARIAYGHKAGSLSSINATSITITFSSDCDQGDPAFAGTPAISGQLLVSSGHQNLIAILTAATETGCTFSIRTADGSNQTSSFTLYFIAVGPTD